MTNNIANLNIKVLLMDTDFYALQAINGYLAWDRRTRVTFMAESVEMMMDYLSKTPLAELPNCILLDADHMGGADLLRRTIADLRVRIPKVQLICLTQSLDMALIETAIIARVNGYLLKHEVRWHIAWAIAYALKHEFIVTNTVNRRCAHLFSAHVLNPSPLPPAKIYPELTDRIEQALRLCVIEGMPAHLAAHEMGISLHTIRGYIKEGYRILESYDESEYPTDMTPQERAFMRFTALDFDLDVHP